MAARVEGGDCETLKAALKASYFAPVQTGAGTPRALFRHQAAAESSSTPVSRIAHSSTVVRRPIETITVVAPAGGWAARRSRRMPPVPASESATHATRSAVKPAVIA